ncbi:MAG: SpaA isopeptide-forming pilin-related protein [Oscillospiraceae bacterium]|uniref:MSCRAMM family protein n=1 Tax=Gemmiger formicilis TaxID=745368 RepID=UPI0024C586E0|nr:MAG: SpaA isopeptide-forming pilin-related protein [Oscillospiraceae bacterium]
MKNKHRIKQCLSLLLAGGIALTNLGAALPAFADDAATTPETAQTATLDPDAAVLYADLPDAPVGSYIGSEGLPVATGQTKISLSLWADGQLEKDSHLDPDALNNGDKIVTVPLTEDTDYAIVPLMAQVEYPADGSRTDVLLPEDVTLLDYYGEPAQDTTVLHSEYTETSAAATGLYLQTDRDFTAQLVYTAPDGNSLTQNLNVVIDRSSTAAPPFSDMRVAPYAGRPTPSVTSGRITKVAKVNATWLIWFNGEPAYCCTHGANGQPNGCPPYSYSHTSTVGADQCIPGDHYGNQIRIWGGLNQLSLDEGSDFPAVFCAEDEAELSVSDFCEMIYDDLQLYIMQHYPDSRAAALYRESAEELLNGVQTYTAEAGYYTYIYQPAASGWQTVALIGPAIEGEEPEPEPVPQEYYADWQAPAQTAGGSFDLTFTVNTDKYQLNTLEKVDGAVITVTPSQTGGSVDGGSWQMTPAGAQTITTSGHTQDDSFHLNGGDGSATWTVHYEVSKTSTSTLSGQEGPFASQAEADAAAEAAKNAAIGQLQNEAQGMVDAAIASARAQLANITFSYDEVTIPLGFDSTPGALGSHQTITVPANSSNDYKMQNDEWSVKVSIDKIDSETKQRIKGDAEFKIFEWDVVRQSYIPFGGYNRYKVERQADGTYKVINHSNYANGSDNIYYTQRNEGKFVIVESRAPSGYYGDWTDVTNPGTAGSVLGKRAYAFEITKALDGQTIWLGNADYNADITMANSSGTLIDTGEGVVTITFGSRNADKTYATDPTDIANNEDSYTMHANADKMQNDRVLGNILLTKVDLDAARYLAAGSNGDTTLEGAVYDLYAADTIEHPEGVSGVVDYSKITDANGTPIWHTTVLTNGGWDTDYLPILQKDRLVASAQIKDGKLAFANLYMGRYYLVERATGLVLPIDGNGKLYITGKYPQLNKKLERTGKYANLAVDSGEYKDYIYKNQYSAVSESRKLDGSKAWDGYYLSHAKGYLCDEVNHYKTLNYADESTYHIHTEQESQDEVLKSGFSLQKLVSTTGQPSPALKLEGAGFTVYRISKLSKAAQFKQNPDGSYDAASILSAYRKDNYDNATLKYDFTAEGQAIANMFESSTDTVNAYNATLTADGDYANGRGNGWMPTDQPAEYRLGEMFTNDEGIFRVEGLPYGQYLVVETTIPKDVFQCDPFIVTVDANSPQSRFTVPAGSVTTATNNYMTYNVLDEELEGYLQLIKTDTETGRAVKIANTSFALYRLDEKDRKTRISMIDPASGNATKKTDVFYTDADGLMKTPEKLPLGRYLIEELQGPEGYYNDSAYSVEFEIKSDRVWQVVGNATNDMDEYIVTEKYCNHETLGQLTIRKLGNVLTDYQDGQFIYTQDNLASAVYEIHAAADIATPDRQGTYWYKSGDLVATVTTGAKGQVDEVKFSPTRTQATYDFLKITHDGTKGEVAVTLPLGKYTITEVKAPYGFILTNQSYTVEFGWDNQKNDIVLAKTIISHEQDGDKECSYSIVNVKDASDAHKNGQTLVFENARVLPVPEKPGDKVGKVGVGIYKQDREALTYLPGAVYELYTVDDIYSADGTKLLDAGTKLATGSTTNASGFTWFDVDVPIRSESCPDSGNSGRYRIVEVKAPAGYLLDSTPVDVEFTYEGQQIAWQIVDGTNTNLRTSVDISKQNITNGKELPGAKLEIRDTDGNLVEGWTSTKTPHTVRGLELEKAYTMTETRAPDGYAEAESIVFKLVQDGSEQSNIVYVKSGDDWVKLDDATVIMQDAPVLDIDKTDIAGNLLPGATLTIHDADGEAIDTWVTDYKTHHVPISDDFLKLSDDNKEYIYTLTEDAAPAGFEIAESVQFKLETVDDGISLFVRENVDAEWVRADKRFIQMIDEATPREDTPTPTPAPTPQPTPAATPAPTPAPTPHKVQTLPQTGDGFPLLAIVVASLASATGIVLLTVKWKNALKETSDEEDADESSDR